MPKQFIFSVTLDSGSDFMDDPVSALVNVADDLVGKIRSGYFDMEHGELSYFKDINGNTVGSAGTRIGGFGIKDLDHLKILIDELKDIRARAEAISEADPSDYESDMGRVEDDADDLYQRVVAVVESMVSE